MDWGQPQSIILPPPVLLSFSSTPPPHIFLILLLFSLSHTHSFTHTHIHIFTRTHTAKRDSIPSLPYRFEKGQQIYLNFNLLLFRKNITSDQQVASNSYEICLLLLLLSHFSRVRICATPSLGFSRQEHWSGLPFPSPMHKSEK